MKKVKLTESQYKKIKLLSEGQEVVHTFLKKAEDIKKGEPESLTKIYDQLEFLLKQKKSIEAIDSLIAGIKAKVDIKVNAKLLE